MPVILSPTWLNYASLSYRGRAIPCGLITYSSETIALGEDSRNPNHFHAFARLKDLLGEQLRGHLYGEPDDPVPTQVRTSVFLKLPPAAKRL